MARQTIETDPYSMDNLDFTLTANPIQPSLPSEEISAPIRYDYNVSESFYEIDVADFNITLFPDQLFKDILNDVMAVGQSAPSSPIMDDINDLLRGDTEVFHSTESNDMANSIQTTDEQLAMIKSNDSTLPVIRSHIEKSPIKNPFHQPISLSKSVAVTVPTPNQLQLVHPLEDTFRARYKSDYFPQKGNVRRPRYIADSVGNHFITLQMPAEYPRGFMHEHVRVSLITTLIKDREYFYSPYKFQTNHNDVKIPDQNPIYISVEKCRGNDSMKLHLVLIKSKLDQLNDAQPLQPFSDTIGSIQNIINDQKLSPKDLINEYQLDKSCIAFTLCTKLPNGSYDVHPETTIISSVITESSTKLPATSNNKRKPVIKNTGQRISCPNCKHCFDPMNVDVKKRKLTGRTSCTTSKTTISSRSNKKKKTV